MRSYTFKNRIIKFIFQKLEHNNRNINTGNFYLFFAEPGFFVEEK